MAPHRTLDWQHFAEWAGDLLLVKSLVEAP
jgi:hypothetical protein